LRPFSPTELFGRITRLGRVLNRKLKRHAGAIVAQISRLLRLHVHRCP
jgi:hypothetical protein